MVNGGANGGEVGGVRSPAAGEHNGVGGEGHRWLTAALALKATDARGERGRGWASRAGERKPKEK